MSRGACLDGQIAKYTNDKLGQPPHILSKEDELREYGYVPKTQSMFRKYVKMRQLDRLEDLLEMHADEIFIDMREAETGRTALMDAVCTNEADIVRVLLEQGADPHIRDFSEMRYTVVEIAQTLCEDDPDYEDVLGLLCEAAGFDRPPTLRKEIAFAERMLREA
mmetsp:Transcript_11433/g.25924  ORF Transcript_11433/g.25924 Transcript_11433/m.25924 type:complete len:164 (-) Transcript_11433:87-578(-)